MDYEQIISILSTICTIILGAFSIYLKTSAKAQTKAKKIQEAIAEITAKAVIFIAEAEEQYRDWTGGEKFDKVVNELYELIPDGLNKIITKNTIEEIVQSTFDEIKVYLTAKMDNALDKTELNEIETEDSVG